MSNLIGEVGLAVAGLEQGLGSIINSDDPASAISDVGQVMAGLAAIFLNNPLPILATNGSAILLTLSKIDIDMKQGKSPSVDDILSIVGNVLVIAAEVGITLTPVGRATSIFVHAAWGLGFVQVFKPFAINEVVASEFNSATQSRRYEPLVFDLDGDGIETVGVSTTAPIMFDPNADSVDTSSGWVAADDAFLVIDKNSNGLIDNGRELFGDATVKSNGQLATDGFDALADLDSNHDGLISAADSQFMDLRLWRDLNQDGVSQSDEVFTLGSQNIVSINLAAANNLTTLTNGNQIGKIGTFTGLNGTTGSLADVNLAQDTFKSNFDTKIPITLAASVLPDMQGAGQVRSLREAASLSPTLSALLTSFASASTHTDQLALIDQIVRAWSDTSAMGTTFTGAYAGHPLTVNFSGLTAGSAQYNAMADTLTLLERFNGRTYSAVPSGTSAVTVGILQSAQALLLQSYDVLKQSVYQSLTLQTRFKPLMDLISVNVTGSGINLEFTALRAELASRIAANPTNGFADFIDFNLASPILLKQSGWDGLVNIATFLDTQPVTADMAATLSSLGIKVKGYAGFTGAGTDGIDFLLGTGVADSVTGGAGDDTLMGLAGNDFLDGGAGSDTLIGGSGNDTLGGNSTSVDSGYYSSVNGGSGNIYQGGTGNDNLNGTAWADLYLFNVGDGQDSIGEVEAYGGGYGQTDTIRFGDGILASQVQVVRSGSNLVLKVSDTDQITVWAWFTATASANNKVERVEFADGTVWLAAEMSARALTVQGTELTDTLVGLANYNNILNGNGGNDSLTGGTLADTLNGGDGNDFLDGGAGTDTLTGGAGNDTLGGYSTSADAGYGSTVNGGSGNIYQGGTGNDNLNGTAWADLYLFNDGDGQDTVSEVEAYGGGYGQTDTIRFGNGILASQVQVVRSGSNLVLKVSDTDQITVWAWFTATASANNKVERVEFVDGTVWLAADMSARALTVQGTELTDTLIGLANYNNILNGNGGNDSLTGGSVADTLNGGDGNDFLDGGAGTDTLNGGAGNDTLGGYGTSVDSGYYSTVSGGSGNIYQGGTGNDSLNGTAWADLYLFNVGDGQDTLSEVEASGGGFGLTDTIRFGEGITASQVQVVRSGSNLVLKLSDTDQITVWAWFTATASNNNKVERVEFSDGTVWLAADMSARALTVQGTELTDTLVGLANYSNILNGNGGNDSLTGGAVADTLNGGDGNDTLDGGAGNDTLIGGAGSDTLKSNLGNDYLSGDTGSDNLIINAGFVVAQGGVDNDTFAGTYSTNSTPYSGATLVDGGAGNDTISALNGLIAGGAGDDSITLTANPSTMLFHQGDGHDTVQSLASSTGTLSLSGIAFEDMTLRKVGADLVFGLGGPASDSITFKNWYAATPIKPSLSIESLVDSITQFNAASLDALLTHRVDTFNLGTIASAFDQARAVDPTLEFWHTTETMRQNLLSTSDTNLTGGSLAYQYGHQDSFANVLLSAAQSQLTAGFVTSQNMLQDVTTGSGFKLIQ